VGSTLVLTLLAAALAVGLAPLLLLLVAPWRWGRLLLRMLWALGRLLPPPLTALLLLFVVLWWFSAKPRARGAVGGLFLAWYGAVRIGVEFVREPDAQLGYLLGGWFTMGMLLSLPMLIGGLWLMLRARLNPQPSGNWIAGA
jgi:hypothetical protein